MLCSLATKLDQGQIAEIETLAKDMGTPILAFACHQMDAAPIDAAQIDRIISFSLPSHSTMSTSPRTVAIISSRRSGVGW